MSSKVMCGVELWLYGIDFHFFVIPTPY